MRARGAWAVASGLTAGFWRVFGKIFKITVDSPRKVITFRDPDAEGQDEGRRRGLGNLHHKRFPGRYERVMGWGLTRISPLTKLHDPASRAVAVVGFLIPATGRGAERLRLASLARPVPVPQVG